MVANYHDRWCHPSCAHVTHSEYDRLGSCDDPWLCPGCCLPNWSDTFIDDELERQRPSENISFSASTGEEGSVGDRLFDAAARPNTVVFCHLNIRSLLPKMDEFRDLVWKAKEKLMFGVRVRLG